MEQKDLHSISNNIKTEARRLGFCACGIAPVGNTENEYQIMQQWVKEGMHGEMTYLEKNLEKRKNPLSIFPSAKSIIVTLTNYYPSKLQPKDTFQVAKYAYGKDYHVIIKRKLQELQNHLHYIYGVVHGKVFVDSSFLFEKAWALKAGLGWIGKNSLLINKEFGSYCFIGVLLVDVELSYDSPVTTSECGSCTKCMETCPTEAIIKPGLLDARKCLSYATIENKKDLTFSYPAKPHHQIYGCDVCQDVCPWNQKPRETSNIDFQPAEKFLSLTRKDWQHLTQEDFNHLFAESSVQRIGYLKLMKNIQSLSS